MNDRTPFVIGNWKMSTNTDECLALCSAVRTGVDSIDNVDTAICPPFVHLARAKERLAGSTVRLGAQNMHWEEDGPYTGEVSPLMLRGLVDLVIIGHSERRQYFCETDETVNRKLKAAFDHGLTPIFCVGETLEQREAGQTEELLTKQVREGLAGVPWTAAGVVAYEPIWAIGTGRSATADQANEAVGFIRRLLADITGAELARATRIQYGGSVKPETAAELFRQPEIDGALVGGASLDGEAFAAIVRAAAEAAA